MSDAATLALIGGHPVLDFANTAGWHASDERVEHLLAFDDVIAWARHAALLSDAEARALRAEAMAHPVRAARAYVEAIELREAVYRVFTALTRGERPTPADLACVHDARVRAFASAVPEWHGARTGAAPGLVLRWPAEPPDFARPLHPIAIAACELLQAPNLERIKQCGNAPCGWLFLDTSRSGTRRWCSSAECGNVQRVRRFRSRRG